MVKELRTIGSHCKGWCEAQDLGVTGRADEYAGIEKCALLGLICAKIGSCIRREARKRRLLLAGLNCFAYLSVFYCFTAEMRTTLGLRLLVLGLRPYRANSRQDEVDGLLTVVVALRQGVASYLLCHLEHLHDGLTILVKRVVLLHLLNLINYIIPPIH